MSVVETKISFEHKSERMAKKNNIVAYNVPENESNSKYKHKESLLKFKQIIKWSLKKLPTWIWKEKLFRFLEWEG